MNNSKFLLSGLLSHSRSVRHKSFSVASVYRFPVRYIKTVKYCCSVLLIIAVLFFFSPPALNHWINIHVAFHFAHGATVYTQLSNGAAMWNLGCVNNSKWLKQKTYYFEGGSFRFLSFILKSVDRTHTRNVSAIIYSTISFEAKEKHGNISVFIAMRHYAPAYIHALTVDIYF